MIEILAPDDGKNWARLIINRTEHGRKYYAYSQRCARDVLHLPAPEPVRRLHLDRDGRVQRTELASPADFYRAAEPEFA